MTTRKTPLCPMLMQGAMSAQATLTNSPNTEEEPRWYPQACACIGSRCAKWAAMTRQPDEDEELLFTGVSDMWCGTFEEPIGNERDEIQTDYGLCIDNLRAVPWPDPATTKED